MPDGVIYLDGNSLGPAAQGGGAAPAARWCRGMGRGADPQLERPRLDRRAAARRGQDRAADRRQAERGDRRRSDLGEPVQAAGRRRAASDRKVLLSEAGDFHTDLHIASGAADLLGLTLDIGRSEVEARIGADTDLLLLTHVHYKTAERFDMARITAKARDAGALTSGISATASARCRSRSMLRRRARGRLRLQISQRRPRRAGLPLCCRASPGPAGQPAARLDGPRGAVRLHRRLRPRRGIVRFLAGTPPILSLAALE